MTETVNECSTCDHCEAQGPVNIWLPIKYKADNWSPSSFSGDELIYACEYCTARYGYNHDLPVTAANTDSVNSPKTKTRTTPLHRVPPYRWM